MSLSSPHKTDPLNAPKTGLSQRAQLSIAAWLESNTQFRLPNQAANLKGALQSLSALPQEKSYLAQAEQLRRYFMRGLLLLFALTFVLGLLAVPPAFAVSASGKVNIFWLLIVMLGFHGINLAIWFIGMLALGRSSNQSKGIVLSTLIFLNQKISKYSHINTDTSSAFWHWQCPAHSNRWLLSTISHTAWLSYLLAGFLMTLLLLLTNQVNFVWETTLLDDQQFLWLTQQLSILPNLLGITVPNQVDILASRVDIISQSASTRQHWASLLLASLILYGVLPRLLLGVISLLMYRLKRVTLPKTTQEQAIERRYQEHANSHIIDKETLDKAKTQRHTSASNAHQQVRLTVLPQEAFSQVWGLFEWSQAAPTCLAGASLVTMLNDASQQHAFLATPHPQPMYILVDGEHSPDRGSRRFLLNAITSHPDVSLVIANGQSAPFATDWQRTGLESGIHPERLFRLMDDKE